MGFPLGLSNSWRVPVNPKETIVGWYATSMEGGAMIVDSSSLIHDFYASECEDPIHLVVDTVSVPQYRTARRGV